MTSVSGIADRPPSFRVSLHVMQPNGVISTNIMVWDHDVTGDTLFNGFHRIGLEAGSKVAISITPITSPTIDYQNAALIKKRSSLNIREMRLV